jgi:uncharacterized membrane protein YqjE
MKVVVTALLGSIPLIGNVLLVCLLVWVVFSIVGVQFFGAKFGRCVDATGSLVARDVVANRAACLALGHNASAGLAWVNPNVNFDNVGNGFLALFQVATFEGWMEVMESAVDSRGVDQQPQRESTMEAYLFFVLFIVIGSFTTLNLFVGIIIASFRRLRAQAVEEGHALLLTAAQQRYLATIQAMLRSKPKRRVRAARGGGHSRPGGAGWVGCECGWAAVQAPEPAGRLARWCYRWTRDPRFELAILVCIGLNTLMFCFEHYEQSSTWTLIQLGANAVFTVVFLAEAAAKLVALGKLYFQEAWNVFDFCIVVISVVGLLVDLLASGFPVNPTALRILRVLRVMRVLRAVKRAQGIQRLLTTLVLSAPALLNIATLLALALFIFAIIGMNLFGAVVPNGVLDDFINFRNFGNAYVSLGCGARARASGCGAAKRG